MIKKYLKIYLIKKQNKNKIKLLKQYIFADFILT